MKELETLGVIGEKPYIGPVMPRDFRLLARYTIGDPKANIVA